MRSWHLNVVMVVTILIFIIPKVLLMVGTSHNADSVTVSWLLLSYWASRDYSWLLLLCSIKLWPIIQATSLERIFLFSLRWPLSSRVISINRSSHVSCLTIKPSLNSSLIKFLALIADISDKLFLAIITPKVKRPVIRDKCLWIIHIWHCKLRSCVLIIFRILSAMLIKLLLGCSLLLAWAVNEVFIFFLLHGVMD